MPRAFTSVRLYAVSDYYFLLVLFAFTTYQNLFRRGAADLNPGGSLAAGCSRPNHGVYRQPVTNVQ